MDQAWLFLLTVVERLLRMVADRVDISPYEIPGVPVENVVWMPTTEYPVIDGFDIGVLPLVDALGAGENGPGRVNGFLAASEAESKEKLATLIKDPALQTRRWETVATSYSFQAIIPKLAVLLIEVAAAARKL